MLCVVTKSVILV